MKSETRFYLDSAVAVCDMRLSLDTANTMNGLPLSAATKQHALSAGVALARRAVELRLASLRSWPSCRAVAALLLALTLSTPALAADAPKPRAHPEITITVKVYPGRPATSHLSKSGCIAWVPSAVELDGGWSACKKLLASK